jgi:hypothetical protein
MTIRYAVHFLYLTLLAFANVAFASEHDNGVRHYLSLGTSLAVGIQPDVAGVNQVTDEGYADQLHDIVAPEFRKLKLTKLGCPGETTVTMINGGNCDYDEGSQLAQAVEFLQGHKGKVAIVTIDMGVNDVLAANCIDVATSNVNVGCLFNAFSELSNNLATILVTLKQAAHPDTEFVAMNYYNTFLAFWLAGPAGQLLAYQSAALADILNYDVLGGVYGAFGIPVADVARAFDSNNFGTNQDTGLPQNVCAVARWPEYPRQPVRLRRNRGDDRRAAAPVGVRGIAGAVLEPLLRQCSGGESLYPRLRPAEDERMNVVRSLVGVHRLEVRHVTEYDVLVRDPVTAVHVARGPRDIQCLAAGIALQQRDQFGRKLVIVLEAARLQAALQPQADLRLHVGELLLDELVRCERPPELLTVEHVLARRMPAGLGGTQCAPGDAVAGVIEAAHRALQAFRVRQQVFLRHEYAVHDDLARDRCAQR